MKKILALTLASVLAFSACAHRSGVSRSIENKAYAVTRLVAKKYLENHPGYREGFELASGELHILLLQETIGVPELLDILYRLPVDKLRDGDTALYIEFGILFFADELGTLSIENPHQVKLAAAGMLRALDKILGPPTPAPPLPIPI